MWVSAFYKLEAPDNERGWHRKPEDISLLLSLLSGHNGMNSIAPH